MSITQFDNVSVIKKSNVYFSGKCISHRILCADGSKKTIGVILQSEEKLKFTTTAPERMEIIAGECQVFFADKPDYELFRAGQSFYIKGNSHFEVVATEIVDYICHFES